MDGDPPSDVTPTQPKRPRASGLMGFFKPISKVEQEHRVKEKVDSLKEAGPCHAGVVWKPSPNSVRQQHFRDKPSGRKILSGHRLVR